MGNKCFFSLSPSANFRASLLLADGTMTFTKIISKRVFERRQQPITQNEKTYIRDLSSRLGENSSLFLTPVGQTKGKMAENRLPATTSGVFSTHVNPSGAR